ncbi:MAG: ABC transporter ATP-binding protein, partial [Erysipelotrichia bacterium]|nr:ABC transporter ATP-binding protein [Erysipelotrichia bacterium]
MIKSMTKVFKSIKDYKKYAIITPLFIVGETAVECTLPFFMSVFVGKIENITHISELLPYFLILIALTAVSVTCGILGGRYA